MKGCRHVWDMDPWQAGWEGGSGGVEWSRVWGVRGGRDAGEGVQQSVEFGCRPGWMRVQQAVAWSGVEWRRLGWRAGMDGGRQSDLDARPRG
jgi:hypothetical protein